MTKSKEGAMTVLEHLSELRIRLAISATALLASAIYSFSRVAEIRWLITAPMQGGELIFLSPPEALTANLTLSFAAGAVIASPVILYQVLAFLFPAFARREKIFILTVLAGICFLFAAGVLFAYRVVFPYTIIFFLQFATESLEAQFIISDYISFFISFHLAFGFVFQLPLLFWALGRAGLISSLFLRRNRKFALLLMLLTAAVITPPDVLSQLIMTVPLLFLYELGIIAVMISERKKAKMPAEAGIIAGD